MIDPFLWLCGMSSAIRYEAIWLNEQRTGSGEVFARRLDLCTDPPLARWPIPVNPPIGLSTGEPHTARTGAEAIQAAIASVGPLVTTSGVPRPRSDWVSTCVPEAAPKRVLRLVVRERNEARPHYNT